MNKNDLFKNNNNIFDIFFNIDRFNIGTYVFGEDTIFFRNYGFVVIYNVIIPRLPLATYAQYNHVPILMNFVGTFFF